METEISSAPVVRPAVLGKWEISRQLRQATYALLKENKDLVWIPFIHAAVAVALTIVFFLVVAIPALLLFLHDPNGAAITVTQKILGILWYVLIFFVGVFFQAATIAVVADRLMGVPTTIGQGFSKAFARVHTLFFWSLIAATVGLVLDALSRSNNILEKIIAAVVGAAWAIATYFVLPEIMLSDVGAVKAVPASIADMRKVWGESAFSVVGVYVFLWLFLLVFFGSIGIAIYILTQLHLVWLAFFFFGVSTVSLIVYAAVAAVLKTILRTVLYLYASKGTIPASFTPELIAQAAVHKK